VADLKALGWTADERFFAYRVTREAVDQQADPRNGPFATIRGSFFAVVDVVKGQQTLYRDTLKNVDESDLTDNQSSGLPALKAMFAEWKRMPAKAAFNAWLTTHKLSPGSEAARCGEATASMVSLPGGETVVGVARDEVTWKHHERGVSKPSWSPACHYVAWVTTTEVLVFPSGPLVEVLAHPKVQAAVEPTLKALAAGGYGATARDPAQKERAKSVVYTWGGARDAAEKVAALVPGGATVEPITWVTPADIVVALGSSALK
jgi:hypothetical protein